MIIPQLAQFDKRRRRSLVVGTMVVAVCLSYFLFTRGSVVKLGAVQARHRTLSHATGEMDSLSLQLNSMQGKLAQLQATLIQHQATCFDSATALGFFEDIYHLARQCKLKPISHDMSPPRRVLVDQKPEEEEHALALYTQASTVTVAGSYFDIVTFMQALTDSERKVTLSEIRIGLPSGEDYLPRAVFKLSLVIDDSQQRDLDEAMDMDNRGS